ncbi:glycerophosphodiester phosphodiesterase family protein [Nocardioides convexus]|uniref:glycerophosphodiester phosphodiesterase family protein n=1 Tax=Nocardioides convexus TaxID=2712224 RepID=UPI0024182FE4|nr:glycerophosphodiester phosphodiesterase family protein [Nocardioides convexus]
MGADYVEPDLVSTKDGVLVARHENEISGTTDVAAHPEFAARKTTKVIDGTAITGWFTEDFTLRETKTLRAKERLPQVRPGNTVYDGKFEIPTFQEVIDLVKTESRRNHRAIGIAPETKHPTYFDSIGLSLEEPLVRTLRRNGLDRRDAKVVIQSFETTNLRQARPAHAGAAGPGSSTPRASPSTSSRRARPRPTPTWSRRRAWPASRRTPTGSRRRRT